MIPRATLIVSLALLVAVTAGAQFSRTGNVPADFPAKATIPDPGGMDVFVPAALGAVTSGWDIANIALFYDVNADTLHLGIDAIGIAGDADGDGFPGMTSAALTGLGGIDRPHFQGTETFAFALDLDNDGMLDVIAGLPTGAGILTGYTVALFNNVAGALNSPGGAFGATLPMHVGTVHASPTAAKPDVECSITNFTDLSLMYYQDGQEEIGVYAFMGSEEDATIGNDYVPSPSVMTMRIDRIECYPAPNYLALVNIAVLPTSRRIVVSYGSLDGYGCCTLVSHDLDVVGKVLPILGNPVVNVGLPGDYSTIVVKDFGSDNTPGRAVTCKELNGEVPNSVMSGTEYHLQFLAYPVIFGSGPFLTSNVYSFIQP